jgi:UDP-N-acetyl-D-galactosamine dehydrogenase
MGLAFKENCPDVRNSRVVDIVRELTTYGLHVDVYDPWVDPNAAREEYRIEMVTDPKRNNYDAIVVAVAHRQFRELGPEGIRAYGKQGSVVYDVKYVLPRELSDDRL